MIRKTSTYHADSLTEALDKFIYNRDKTSIGKLFSIKENGKNIINAIYSVFPVIAL
jgi:hypothetical protein